MLKVEFCG